MSSIHRWNSHAVTLQSTSSYNSSAPVAVRTSPVAADHIAEDPANEKRSLERVAAILLQDNLNLLAALCQCTFVGDSAATIATHLIQLLRLVSDYTAENFVMRTLRSKIVVYASKEKKLADLLRDNSMSTMLLTAFARSTGSAYLQMALAAPIREIATYVHMELEPKLLMDLERPVSPARNTFDSPAPSEPGSATNSVPSLDRPHESDERIIRACTTLLQAIVDSQEKIPREVRRICCFIEAEAQQAMRQRESMHFPKNAPAAVPRPRKHRSKDVQPPQRFSWSFTARSSKDNIALGASKSKSSTDTRASMTYKTVPNTYAGASSHVLDRALESPVDGPCSNIDSAGPAAASRLSMRSDTSKSTSQDICADSYSDSNVSTIFTKPSAGDLIADLEPVTESPLPEPSKLRENRDDEDYLRTSNSQADKPRSQAEEGNSASLVTAELTLPQRIVGTLLFLRFIVPAITAPENFNLSASNKMDNSVRRGLIQCGKILNGFCSEADFRNKEGSSALHQYIDTNRAIVRDFISFVTTEVKQQQRSPSPRTSATVPIFPSTPALVVDRQLCVALARSLPRIEKDLGLLAIKMSATESTGVMSGFAELKRELGLMNLQPTTASLAEEKQPVGFLASLGRRFGTMRRVSSAHFFTSRMERARSHEEIGSTSRTLDRSVSGLSTPTSYNGSVGGSSPRTPHEKRANYSSFRKHMVEKFL